MLQVINTCDPYVFIEEQRDGYVRYFRTTDGKRWEVWGVCTDVGECYKGANGPKPELDCPVAPGFKGCCDLKIVELDGD